VGDGLCVFVDDAGTVYAFRISTGRPVWTKSLGSPPVQPPYASRLGFLVAGQDGTPWTVAPADGTLERLSAPGTGRTFALPLGEGAVLLGGGAGGFRRVGPDRVPKPLGDASPSEGRAPYVDGQQLAWIEAGGAWFASAGGGGPIAVPALGSAPVAVAGEGSVLYAVDEAGLLTAVDATHPSKVLWEAPTGGTPGSGLILARGAVLLLVDGAVVAVER
jgi:outer membrane protein assembly factor BamB